MAYADHVRSASRPSCWGNTRSYDPNDVECAECRFRHSCSAEIDRGGRVHVHTSSGSGYRTNYRRSADEGEVGVNQPAVVEQGEKPVERFAKDALAGGLRGMFYEMWQFWRHYRIR